jgi:hypothetical protein
VSAALFISVASLTLAFLSFAVNFALNQRAAVRARKPVLVFVDDPDAQCWVLRNVGNGPALNVVVAQRQRKLGWFNPVRLPPLGRDGDFRLHWLGRWSGGGLGAVYSDFEDRRYTSTLGGELSRTYEGHRLPRWRDEQVKRYWNPEIAADTAVREVPPWAVEPSDFDTGVTPGHSRGRFAQRLRRS